MCSSKRPLLAHKSNRSEPSGHTYTSLPVKTGRFESGCGRVVSFGGPINQGGEGSGAGDYLVEGLIDEDTASSLADDDGDDKAIRRNANDESLKYDFMDSPSTSFISFTTQNRNDYVALVSSKDDRMKICNRHVKRVFVIMATCLILAVLLTFFLSPRGIFGDLTECTLAKFDEKLQKDDINGTFDAGLLIHNMNYIPVYIKGGNVSVAIGHEVISFASIPPASVPMTSSVTFHLGIPFKGKKTSDDLWFYLITVCGKWPKQVNVKISTLVEISSMISSSHIEAYERIFELSCYGLETFFMQSRGQSIT